MNVRFSKRAEREAARTNTRWRTDRPAAPDLFLDELATAIELLLVSPEMGTPFGTWQGTHLVRRVLLERSNYHLFYAIEADAIVLLSIWGTRRGRGPRLGRGQ